MPELQSHPSAPVRATRNRFDYTLVVLLLAAALAPLVLSLGYLIPAGLVRTFNRTPHGHYSAVRDTSRPSSDSAEWMDRMDQGPLEIRTSIARQQQEDRALTLKLMPVAVVLLSAALALLLWGMSSSSTASLLAQMGARPAGKEGHEADAVQAVANLAHRLRIHPPKLYIVHSSFPSTFSAGTNAHNALVAVTSGALDLLEAPEVENLLAHEIAHISNRDSRLDVLLTSVSTITEYPLNMFRRQMSSNPSNKTSVRRRLALLEMALSPLGLYVLFISPLFNRLLRAIVLRGREINADSTAAMLTGNPEALAYALAKIGGVASVLKKSAPTVMPAHASLSERIQHLTKCYAAKRFDGLRAAIEKGRLYVQERPGMAEDQIGSHGSREHLVALNNGNVMGRVYRLLSNESVPVFEHDGPKAMVRARIKPNALLVVFDAPGKMRQVNTAEEAFGYISREVKLKLVPGVLPQEVYDPIARAAAEEVLARQIEVPQLPQPAIPAPQPTSGLTRLHIWMVVGFGAVVCVGTTLLMFVFTRN